MSARAYDTIRTMIERLGGTMEYHRKGYRYGAWIIRIDGKKAEALATGNRSFPDLDGLHIPKHSNPKHWDDYSTDLLPDAEQRLRSMLR